MNNSKISSEVLLWTDLHFHPHKRSAKRIDDCINVINWVFQTAKDRNIKNIIFAGDFFHDRQKIEIYTYYKGFEAINRWMSTGEYNLYVLVGNHDMWFNDLTSITSVYPFSCIKNCQVVSEPSQIKVGEYNWDFVPFNNNPLKSLLKKSDFAVGHLAVDGAVLHGNIISDVVVEYEGDMVKVDKDCFTGYKKVFLGHYHAAQKLNDVVEYIGSPLELSFGEAGQEKHIVIFNCETLKTEYVVNDFSPKHFVVSPQDLKTIETKNNFVKIYVDDMSSAEVIELRNNIKDTGSLEFKQNKVHIDEVVVRDAKNILLKEDDMLVRYVEETGFGELEKEKLLEIGKRICERQKVV